MERSRGQRNRRDSQADWRYPGKKPARSESNIVRPKSPTNVAIARSISVISGRTGSGVFQLRQG
ncbi:hypothetical protein U1Q18_027360 [Sarracenia purpurea var. burkii]